MIKSNQNWGGNWTEEKLDAFEKYVNAYLTIMHATRQKFNGWPQNIIYFDGFAGSGIKEQDKIENNSQTLPFDIEQEEQEVYRGSVERVLKMDKKFDKYYFVDTDKNAIEQLKTKLKNENIDISNCYFLEGDVNEKVNEFVKEWDKQKTALVLLDPFGMQVKWETIQKFKDKRIDLWILVPSGVIINRLLDRQGKLKNIKLLETNLGMSEKEIKAHFYVKKKETTLFGNEEKTQKIPNAIHRIAELYVKKLKSVFKYVTETPLELKNSRNVTIFHFIFGSNNEGAKKIAKQIIEKKQK